MAAVRHDVPRRLSVRNVAVLQRLFLLALAVLWGSQSAKAQYTYMDRPGKTPLQIVTMGKDAWMEYVVKRLGPWSSHSESRAAAATYDAILSKYVRHLENRQPKARRQEIERLSLAVGEIYRDCNNIVYRLMGYGNNAFDPDSEYMVEVPNLKLQLIKSASDGHTMSVRQAEGYAEQAAREMATMRRRIATYISKSSTKTTNPSDPEYIPESDREHLPEMLGYAKDAENKAKLIGKLLVGAPDEWSIDVKTALQKSARKATPH